MAANSIHISISAERIFSIGGFDISNSIFTSLIVSTMLIAFALAVRSQLSDTKRPTGLQNFAEWLIESLYSLVYSVTGNARKARLFFPFIATFFLFILLNNWLGLLPGVGTVNVIVPEESVVTEEHASTGVIEQVNAATTPTASSAQADLIVTEDQADTIAVEENLADDTTTFGTELDTEQPTLVPVDNHAIPDVTTDQQVTTEEHPVAEAAAEGSHEKKVPILRPGSADLNTTLALALFSVGMTQLFGYHFQKFGYFKKFINFSSPIMFFVGILEVVSEFAKIISFAFRLFGNIFAGEVLLAVMMFLVPLVIPMPFYGLEIFVGFIQAVVFAMLSLVFFNMASESHDSH